MDMEATTMENIFGERLKEIRNANNMSQNELANYLDITPSSLSYYENGVRNPPITILPKLVERFNVSVNWLIGVENPSDKEPQNYADMARHILPLINRSDIWVIWSYKKSLPDENLGPEGLLTRDKIILRFLDDYNKMSNLTIENSVPEDLFQAWINNRMQELEKILLPSKNEKLNEQ